MPDASGLYPQPIQPQQNVLQGDPLRFIGAISQMNALARFNKQFAAEQATGQAYQNALRPDGSIDLPAVVQGLKDNPNAAFTLPQVTSGILDQHGKQIANSTAQFEQGAKQNQFIVDGLGALADKPGVTAEDARHFIVTAARNTNIPSPVLAGWLNGLPNDPQALPQYLKTLRNMAIGSAGVSTRVAGPPDPTTGAPQTVSIGEANYGGTGAPAPGSTAPLVPTRVPTQTIRPGMATGLPPGAGEAQGAEAVAGQQAAIGLQNAANEIPAQRTQLDLMRQDLATAADKFGPTAKYEKVANIIANRIVGFHPTMPKEQIAALESFDKVGKQIAMSQAGTLHATDAYLSNSLGANPNTDLSAYGNEGIINMLHGNADAIAVKAREWNKARQAGIGPDKFYQWSDQFNQQFDPRVFQFMRMNHDQQATLLKSVEDKAQFENNLMYAHQKGWIKLPRGPLPPDARQADDGNHYVPDPKRPGSYLRVDH